VTFTLIQNNGGSLLVRTAVFCFSLSVAYQILLLDSYSTQNLISLFYDSADSTYHRPWQCTWEGQVHFRNTRQCRGHRTLQYRKA
jgi:hypothetical protein